MTTAPKENHRSRAVLVTVLALAFVASLTLRPAHFDPLAQPSPFSCLIDCGEESIRDLLSNILLFMPLGWALSHWMKRRAVLLTCLLATVLIEGLQATVIAGRDSSLRDILSNVVGGALGAWLFRHWREIVHTNSRRSAWLGVTGVVVWSGVLAATAAGNQLAPSAAPWYGHWTPDLAAYQRYPGRLLAAEIDGVSPSNGPIMDPAPLRNAMRRDSFRLTLQVVTGAKPRGQSLILAVIDANHRAQLLVGQERGSIWLRWRNRFEAWDLRGITLRLPTFPGSTPGSMVLLESGIEGRNLLLRATNEGIRSEVRVPQTVGLGWTSMLPFRLGVFNESAVFNPVWLASLVLPLAYWFGRASPRAGLAMTFAAIALGLLLIPALGGAAPTTWPEWIGGVVGGLSGWSAGARSRLRPTREPRAAP